MNDFDVNKISPYIRLAWYDVAYPPWIVKERVLFDYELLFVKSGNVVITINDERYEALPGDVFLFKPRQKHSISLEGDKPFIQPHVHFDLIYQEDSSQVPVSFLLEEEMNEYQKTLFREDITEKFISPFPNHIRLKSPYIFEQRLFDLIHVYEKKDPFYEIELKSIFLQLWNILLQEIDATNSHKRISIEYRVKEYIEHNLNKSITLNDLAQKVYVNKYYIVRLFKNTYHISPIQYHTEMRIQQCVKLMQTNMTLTEISEKMGFSSLHDFSRAFKRNKGISPSQFRKLLLEKE